MASKYGRTARSSAFQWFAHRITGTFLIFLLITHFWVQHFDRTTASVSHSVVTAEEAEAGVLPRYSDEAEAAVRAFQGRERQPSTDRPRVVPAQDGRFGQIEGDAPGPTHPPGETAGATPYDVLMLRLGDPVYAVLWKGFNLLFLLFALHHGFYGLNNVLTDYIRNDMARVGAIALSWTLALVLFLVGAYSVIVAGL
jgi:succinate dehydrogenase / fumarate reductase, membrane anchor subunit